MAKLRFDVVSYVLQHGSAYDKLYLARALKHKPDPRWMEDLLAQQNPDGGWPRQFGKQMPSGVVTSARVLELLLKTGLDTGSAAAERATRFLLLGQRDDGGWSENPELAALIPKGETWVSVQHSMTYTTADAVNALVQAGLASQPSVKRGIQFLRTTQNEEGGWDSHLAPGQPQRTDVAAMDVIVKALVLSGEPSDSAVLRCTIQALVTNRAHWDIPVSAAAVLNVFCRLGYAAEHPYVEQLVDTLIRTQAADGGWSWFGTGPSDPGQTVYSAKQLIKCGVEIPAAWAQMGLRSD
jgi:hypothetical protein